MVQFLGRSFGLHILHVNHHQVARIEMRLSLEVLIIISGRLALGLENTLLEIEPDILPAL